MVFHLPPDQAAVDGRVRREQQTRLQNESEQHENVVVNPSSSSKSEDKKDHSVVVIMDEKEEEEERVDKEMITMEKEDDERRRSATTTMTSSGSKKRRRRNKFSSLLSDYEGMYLRMAAWIGLTLFTWGLNRAACIGLHIPSDCIIHPSLLSTMSSLQALLTLSFIQGWFIGICEHRNFLATFAGLVQEEKEEEKDNENDVISSDDDALGVTVGTLLLDDQQVEEGKCNDDDDDDVQLQQQHTEKNPPQHQAAAAAAVCSSSSFSSFFFYSLFFISGLIFSVISSVPALESSVSYGMRLNFYQIIIYLIIFIILVGILYLQVYYAWTMLASKRDFTIYLLSRFSIFFFYLIFGLLLFYPPSPSSSSSIPSTQWHLHHYLLSWYASLFAIVPQRKLSLSFLAVTTGIYIQGIAAYGAAPIFSYNE